MNTLTQNKLFIGLVLVFVTVISLYFFMKFVNEIKQSSFIGSGATATNRLVVSGNGEASAIPDIATINYTVQEQAKTVAEAEKKATDKANKSIDFLKKSGVDEKDIKLANNSFNPEYDYGVQCYSYPCPTQKPVITGYSISRSITVKIREIDDSGKIVQGLGEIGVSNLNGPTFGIDDEDGVKESARKDAIDNAKEKAQKLADDLGVKLVRIIDFSEGGNQGYPTPMYEMKTTAVGLGGGAPIPDLPKGENKYTSNVTITYEIK